MVTKEENLLLTQVDAGTEMGDFLRQFWMPVLPSEEAPQAGRMQLRVRLLGEDLVLFRNTEGKLGLLGERCSHRRATLYFGRNEDCGLRCAYHGWLYSLDGTLVETPNEPDSSQMNRHVKHPAYPCEEINGTVWTYMGGGDARPPLPDFAILTAPAENKNYSLVVREYNWLQAIEGDLDLSHGAYLHSTLRTDMLSSNHLDRYVGEHPHFDAVDTDYGIKFAVRRNYDADNVHWGVGHFLFPCISMFPPVGWPGIIPGHFYIPMDAHTTLVWAFTWNPMGPIQHERRRENPLHEMEWQEYKPATPEAGGRWRYKADFSNNYGFNEEAQRTLRYSGLPTVDMQDMGMQQGMGLVAYREFEHLGATDIAQRVLRKRLLQAASDFRTRNALPGCATDGTAFRVRGATGLLPRDSDWVEGTKDWLHDELGVPAMTLGHRLATPEELARFTTNHS